MGGVIRPGRNKELCLEWIIWVETAWNEVFPRLEVKIARSGGTNVPIQGRKAELGAWNTSTGHGMLSEQGLALPKSHHFCLCLGISSSFFFSLCFSVVSVEKVELKGLAHKKNERNVEYSFEVSLGFLCYERREDNA